MKIEELVKKIEAKDVSVWIKEEEIENRIDWINLNSNQILEKIENKVGDLKDYDNVILLGMGGSSLAALVFTTVYETTKNIFVLDTINPDQIYLVTQKISDHKNIFIISSKSGTTLETKILYQYFHTLFGSDTFIFITDEGTSMDKEAKMKGNIVFNPNPNIGGRYSAFTEFGLVPAFLAGVNTKQIVQDYEDIKQSSINFIKQNFQEFYELEKLEKNLQDFYYILFEYEEKDKVIGLWLEQLIAESSGKNKKGILPVVHKNLNFKNIDQSKILGKFKLLKFVNSLPKWMYVWFLYTAAACSLLKVNPFNQPDVQLSKDITNKILGLERVELESHYEIINNREVLEEKIIEYLKKQKNYYYIAIQFYSCFEEEGFAEKLRENIVKELGTVVVWGFGPRYLHSIGQLYKGGPDNAVFLQIIIEPNYNIDKINKYFVSQALGDLITMKNLSKNIKGFYVKT